MATDPNAAAAAPAAGDEASQQGQQQQQPESSAAGSSAASSTSSTAKSVFIFRNGDIFAPSKKFVLNRRQLRDWDVFLEQVTMSVNPLRGAVRAIVTPKRGRRRIQDLDAFEDKAHYVALSRGERFKPMNYVPEGEATAAGDQQQQQQQNGGASPKGSPRRPVGVNRVVLEPILPVVHNKKLMSVQPRFGAKMDVISAQSKAVKVYRNGDEFTPAIIVMLRPAEQVSMEVVLRAVEERVVLPNNMAIRKLYDMNGRRIREPRELQHEKFYVAAGHEPFLSRPYGQKLPYVVIGRADRKSTIKYLSQPITPAEHSSRKSKEEQQQPAAASNSKGGDISVAEKSQAAGQIQASVRGFQTRKAAAEKQTGRPVTIQPDPANAKPTAKAKPSKEDQEKSASAIQGSVKGFQARREAASKVAKRPIEVKNEPANSKKAQQPSQAKQPRQMTAEEQAAAKSIQASVNSYKTRKTVAKQQADKTPSGQQ